IGPDGRTHLARRQRRSRRAARQGCAGDDVRGRHELRRAARPASDREQGLVSAEPLRRGAVVRELLTGRDELVVVTGLGSSSYDAMAAGDHDLNYYLWGAMG